MKSLILTKKQARRLLLIHQELWPANRLQGKQGICDFIQKVGCIQFDPLNIIGHNHELVLQSRIADFSPITLQKLLYSERKLIDGWDKMMSIYSVSDWPYFERYRKNALRKYGESTKPIQQILPQVRQMIYDNGPLSSLDLDFNHMVNWSWAPTRASRAALESMYFWGELIIHHKTHTRKFYDFTNRHLPANIIETVDPFRTLEEFHDWLVLRRIGGVGLLWNRSGDAWLGLDGIKSRERDKTLLRLKEQGKVVEVAIEGCNIPFYLRTQDWAEYQECHRLAEAIPTVSFLAPLDNLLWDRRLIRELFDFDYRWEVYKPANQRQYGYYVLPVLYGDQLIARIEPRLSQDKQN